MDETVYKVIQLLIEVGLSPVIAEELSDKIDNLYIEKNKQLGRIGGMKGGKAKVLKGPQKLRVTDPAAYERYMKKWKASRKRTLDKRA